MARRFGRYWIMLAVALFAVVAIVDVGAAVSVNSVPNPLKTQNSWVSDPANMLSPQTEERLNQMIDEFEARTGGEIAVVTVQDTKPSASPNVFATDLFNKWGIGKPDKNNGILLLISKNERRTEIKPGKGLADVFTPEYSKTILRNHVTPKFKQGKFDAGTIAGVDAIIVTAENPPEDAATWQAKWKVAKQRALDKPIVPSKRVINGLKDPRQRQEWIADKADLLDVKTKDDLNRKITQFEADTSAEIVIVTVPAARPAVSSAALAKQLFEQWSIGKKGARSGYLFLLSKHDEQFEMVGYEHPLSSRARLLPRNASLSKSSISADVDQIVTQHIAEVGSYIHTTQYFADVKYQGRAILADGEWDSGVSTKQDPPSFGLGMLLLMIFMPNILFLAAVGLLLWSLNRVVQFFSKGRRRHVSSSSSADYSSSYDYSSDSSSSYSSYDSGSSYDSSSDFSGGGSDYDSGGGDSW